MIKTKGIVERLEGAIAKATSAASCEEQVDILHQAMLKELALVKEISDMPAFRAWFEGERFNVNKIKGRK